MSQTLAKVTMNDHLGKRGGLQLRGREDGRIQGKKGRKRGVDVNRRRKKKLSSPGYWAADHWFGMKKRGAPGGSNGIRSCGGGGGDLDPGQ